MLSAPSLHKVSNWAWASVKRFLQRVDEICGDSARAWMSRHTAVRPDTVMFMTYNNHFMCNPRAAAEELIRRKAPYRLVWAVSRGQNPANFPPEITLVRRNSVAFFREVASAKVWVDNAIAFVWRYLPKKPSQTYFNTWHGSLGIKRIDKDAMSATPRWLRSASFASKETDYVITNSVWEEGVFRGSHWPNTPFLRLGHPRNDLFFRLQDEKVAELKRGVFERYKIKPDSHTLLYAPTFRLDKAHERETYDIDYHRLVQALHARFGGNWTVLVRYHYQTKATPERVDGQIAVQVADWPDIQDLCAVADAAITDYSSWIFDFLLTGRPGFIYAPDLPYYDTERGLYYDVYETPFPVATTNDELDAAVTVFDQDEYTIRAAAFLDDKGCMEDGHAAERLADEIQRAMESN